MLKNGIYVATGNLAVAAANLAVASIVTTKSGLQVYGEYILYQTVFLTWCLVSRPTTWQAIIKFSPTQPLSQLVRLSLKLEIRYWCTSSTLLIATYFTLSEDQFSAYGYDLILLTVILGSLAINNGTLLGYARAQDRFRSITLIQITSSISKTIAVTFFNNDALTLFLLLVAIDFFIWLTAILINLFRTTSLISILTRLRNEPEAPTSDFSRFSAWGTVHAILDLPVTQLDKLLVSALLGKEAAGAIDIVKKMSQIIGQIANPIYLTVLPWFSREVAAGRSGSIVKSCIKLTSALFAFGVAFMCTLYLIYEPFNTTFFSGELGQHKSVILFYTAVQSLALCFIWIHPLTIAHGKMKTITAALIISNSTYLLIIYLYTETLALHSVPLAFLVQATFIIALKLYVLGRSN